MSKGIMKEMLLFAMMVYDWKAMQSRCPTTVIHPCEATVIIDMIN